MPNSKHVIKLNRVDRGPFLTPRYTPICPTCGPLCAPTDHDTANELRRHHEANMRASAIAREVGGK